MSTHYTDLKKIICDLEVLSKLSPGLTLSTSTMTIINHETWSGSLWRTYARENRKDTISFIKSIFTEAISILELNYSQELADAVKTALKGFSSLKETYKGD